MSKRGVLVVGLLVIMILIVSCGSRIQSGEKPTETAAALKAVQSGTQGVELSLMPGYPASIIYDQNELVAILEIKNKGNHNLEPNACFVQISGFDPNIIRGGLEYPRSCAENYGVLEGKSVYNLNGGINQLDFHSSSIELTGNVFEYNPTLNFKACYNYHTSGIAEVCIDPAFYQITSEQKTCQPQDVMMGGGQGAPVGVSYVGVDMAGDKAVFEINIRNLGGGRVLSPYTDVQSCDFNLAHSDLDRVAYNIEMSGAGLLDCQPRDGFVRLYNNQGKIICSVSLTGGISAYQTPLTIDLNYNYISSPITKQVKIIKTPQ